MSLPLWECGLKCRWGITVYCYVSHSLCGSVDWNRLQKQGIAGGNVTPFVGVWIEIQLGLSSGAGARSHSLCGSVDWNEWSGQQRRRKYRHSLCGSVDWNWNSEQKIKNEIGHSLCGSVDWNKIPSASCKQIFGHSLCGSVDWNRCRLHKGKPLPVTPFVGVWIEISWCRDTLLRLLSLPLWECGLKLVQGLWRHGDENVTPFVGVWIEMLMT